MTTEARRREPPLEALDPARSVVIEACAGSGKTWLLVSRIVRLMLSGVAPSRILAITFTRKAAQEMAARLREWLCRLATEPDEDVRDFLRARGVPEAGIEDALAQARLLYERFLTAQPGITITTFHSWFLQLLRRAPLDAGALGEVNLIEQTSSLVADAWDGFATRVQRDQDTPAARGLERLFRDYGLENTRRLLTNFLYRRADWWAYTRGAKDPVGHALGELRKRSRVDPDADLALELFSDGQLAREIGEYATFLSRNTTTHQEFARQIADAQPDPARLFEAICRVVMTENGHGKPRALKPSPAQAKRLTAAGEARFIQLHARLAARLHDARLDLAEQVSYRFNEAAMHCGAALLEAYQRVKRERQVIDYGDVEWHAWELLSVGDHAVFMHFKLDSRYRHVLVDEFQDTNPLQWLTLKSWLEAAAAADVRPSVFMVGDPKQSIYRFRRAEARLFGIAARYLEDAFAARKLPQDETRRCPAPVVEVVNRLFTGQPDFNGFEQHVAHYADKPGRVEVLPLAAKAPVLETPAVSTALRNPLVVPLRDEEDRRRQDEAAMLVERIRAIRGHWRIATDLDGRATRAADYRDFMILVRRRTHLGVYERALRDAGIPYVTSRQGGLLDTLEAQDVVALLEFLVSPFSDLKLAHALRSPIFGCSDEDLMMLAGAADRAEEVTWWDRLRRLAPGAGSPGLRRAHDLLARWLERSGSAPVHDQLDRIYFEGDVLRRYDQAVPAAMRGTVRANLQAFMQRALDTDSGRYPSLPRFLHELIDLREAPAEEAPDEGIVGDAGNAVRIYTVHGAKGLQAPIVWLLDAAAGQDAARGYDVLLDWPPDSERPASFSLYPRAKERSRAQQDLSDVEAALARREDLNMLYVAMTRAQQALIVSGAEGRGQSGSWYERVRAAAVAASGRADDPELAAVYGEDLSGGTKADGSEPQAEAAPASIDIRLCAPLPTGQRAAVVAGRGPAYGVSFHSLMERLTGGRAPADRATVQRDLGLPDREFGPMWEQAQRVLAAPHLARFFDPGQHRRAVNEISYVGEDGNVRRIDRLVELDDGIWVLDYKTGDSAAGDAALIGQYRAQLADYRDAMRLAYGAGRLVHAAIIFADGNIMTLED